MDERSIEERNESAVRQELHDLKQEARRLGLASELRTFSSAGFSDQAFITALRPLLKIEQRRVNEEQLWTGTYYLTIDQVFATDKMDLNFTKQNYMALCRNYSPDSTSISCQTSGRGTLDPYKITFQVIGEEPNLSAATAAGQSHRSFETTDKATIRPGSVSLNTFAGELARLIPAAPTAADSYFLCAISCLAFTRIAASPKFVG